MVADTERLLLRKSRTGSQGFFHFGNFYNFLGLISFKCCNIVFFLYLLYVVFIFLPCKRKFCH